MAQYKNVMEIFTLLDKSNCRRCNKPTCMAFAADVFMGKMPLSDCPALDREIVDAHGGDSSEPSPIEQGGDQAMEALKAKIAATDLAAAARRLGVDFSGGRIILECLGKRFAVDTKGDITTDIHVNPWITIPVFNYILEGRGVKPSGEWVPLRELEGGKRWYRLYGQRCEKPLKKVADGYTDLFEDMLDIFNGRQVENHYASDISLILYPLPNFPILICFWKPEDGLDSNLNIFFDSTAEENLNIDSIFTLSAGLVNMFEKIARNHGGR